MSELTPPPAFPLPGNTKRLVRDFQALHTAWVNRYAQHVEGEQAFRDEDEALGRLDAAIATEIDHTAKAGVQSAVLAELRVKRERAAAAAHPDDRAARRAAVAALVQDSEHAYRQFLRERAVELNNELRQEADEVQAEFEAAYDALQAIERRRELIRGRSLAIGSEVVGPRPAIRPGMTSQPAPLKGFTADDVDLTDPRRSPLLTDEQLRTGRRHDYDDVSVSVSFA